MLKQKIWLSVEQIFTELNDADCVYAVLRNYECMSTGNPFVDGHDDIDLLCNDSRKVQKILCAKKRFLFPTVNSYYISFQERSVNVDIRFVGDGYYDTAWERKMLANRVLIDDNIYVLDSINYFYSLIYHALFQKHCLSDEYLVKLLSMAKALCIPCRSPLELLQILEDYMLANNYYYTITQDPGIILNFDSINKARIESNHFWLFKRHVLNFLKRNRRIAQKYV